MTLSNVDSFAFCLISTVPLIFLRKFPSKEVVVYCKEMITHYYTSSSLFSIVSLPPCCHLCFQLEIF